MLVSRAAGTLEVSLVYICDWDSYSAPSSLQQVLMVERPPRRHCAVGDSSRERHVSREDVVDERYPLEANELLVR